MRTLCGDQFVDFMKSFYEDVRSRVTIRVEGYDTSLPAIDTCRALKNHFTSCGEVEDIQVPRDPVTKAVKSYSFVVLRGEGAEEKALALNGSDMGGWKVAIQVVPLPQEFSEGSTDEVAAKRVAHFQRLRSDGISVTGYDPCLPEDYIKSALKKHFSSCGLITDVFVLNSRAIIYFYGLGAIPMALRLCRRKVGEWKLVANALPIPNPKENHCHNVPLGPLFGSASAAPDIPRGPLFGSASDVDMMDFEYTAVPAPGGMAWLNESAYG